MHAACMRALAHAYLHISKLQVSQQIEEHSAANTTQRQGNEHSSKRLLTHSLLGDGDVGDDVEERYILDHHHAFKEQSRIRKSML